MKTEPRPDTEFPVHVQQPIEATKNHSGLARLAVVSVVSLLVGYGVGVAGGNEEAQPTVATPTNATEPTIQPTPEATPEPTVFELRAADVALDLKVLSKENFGSAGSLIEYRIEPILLNSVINSLPEDGVWEVTFEVLGGEDGATIDTFRIWGNGEYEVPEGIASTPSTNTQLRLSVTNVEDVSGMTSG
jgi:hypothetical protein